MKEITGSLLERLRKSEIAWLAMALVWVVWMLEPFYFIGMTTSDQLGFSLVNPENVFSSAYIDAKSQGRIYFLLTKPVDYIMASSPSSTLLNGLSLFVFAISPIALAFAVFRDAFSRYLYVFVFLCLAWIGFDHMPPAAYPVVNHMAFPVWAVIALLLRRAESSRKPAVILFSFFCLSFFALFQYEPVAAMTIVIVLWLIHTSELESRRRKQFYATFVAALGLYGTLYLFWANSYPSNYDGLEAGDFSAFSVIKPVVSYTLGALPFVIPDMNTVYLELSDDQVWASAISYKLFAQSGLKPLTLLLVCFGSVAVFVALGSKLQKAKGERDGLSDTSSVGVLGCPKGWCFLLLGIGLAIAPNVLLGFSSKYQGWADTWREAYLTSQLSLYGWCVFFVFPIRWFASKFSYRGVSIGLGFVVVLFVLISIPNRKRNDMLAIVERTHLARWEAVAVLNSTRDYWEAETVFAPQLRLMTFAVRKDWPAYWNLYTKAQYDWDMKFEHEVASNQGDSKKRVGVRYLTDDKGFLTTVVIQSADKAHIIAPLDNPPRVVVSNVTGKGILFKWNGESRDLDYKDFRILTLEIGSSDAGLIDPLRPFSNIDIWF